MSNLSPAITFAARLYRDRADIAWAGLVRRDPMALLELRPGREDPYTIYDRLRKGGPLTPTRLGSYSWVSTSHRMCDSVLRDRRFGVRPQDEDQAAGDELEMSFLGLNPPDHTRLRKLATPAFNPKVVAGYAGRIERTTGNLLDAASSAGRFDLVSGLAAPLPIAVITDLLGISDADSTSFARYGMLLGSALDGIRSLPHAAQLQAASNELIKLFEHLFELRRREPGDDILSHLVAAEGDQIQPAEMLAMCVLLLVAGFETTVNLISNAVLALLSHPAQWLALCADPAGLAPRAVEETLRWGSASPADRPDRPPADRTRGQARAERPAGSHHDRGREPGSRGLRTPGHVRHHARRRARPPLLLQRHPLLHRAVASPPGGGHRAADARRADARPGPRRIGAAA